LLLSGSEVLFDLYTRRYITKTFLCCLSGLASTGYTFCQHPCRWLKNCYVSLSFVLSTARGVGWRLCEIHALSRLGNILDATEMKVISSLTLTLCVVKDFVTRTIHQNVRGWVPQGSTHRYACPVGLFSRDLRTVQIAFKIILSAKARRWDLLTILEADIATM